VPSAPWGFLDGPPGQNTTGGNAGQPPSGAGFYFQPPNQADYIYPDPRPLSEIGTPDFHLQQLNRAPTALPGQFYPQPGQMGQIYGQSAGVLGAMGSGNVAPYALAGLKYAANYQAGYIKGMIARQEYDARQMAINFTKMEENQSIELQNYWRIWSGYADNPNLRKQKMLEYAHTIPGGDAPMVNILTHGTDTQIQDHLTNLDTHWLTVAKANRQNEKAQEAQADTQAEEQPDEFQTQDQGDRTTQYPQYQPPAQETPQEQAQDDAASARDPDATDPADADTQQNRDRNAAEAGAPQHYSLPAAESPTTSGAGAGLYNQASPEEMAQAQRDADAASDQPSFDQRFGGQPSRAPAIPPVPSGSPAAPTPAAPGFAPTGGPTAGGDVGNRFDPSRGIHVLAAPRVPKFPRLPMFGGSADRFKNESVQFLADGKDPYHSPDPLAAQKNDQIHRGASALETYINRVMDQQGASPQEILREVAQVDPDLARQAQGIGLQGIMQQYGRGNSQRYNRILSALIQRTGGDATLFNTRRKIREDYTPGGYAGKLIGQITNLDAAQKQLVIATRALPPGTPIMNEYRKWLNDRTGVSPAFQNFMNAFRQYVSIIVRLDRRGQGSETDIQRQIDTTPPWTSKQAAFDAMKIDSNDAVATYNDFQTYWNQQMPNSGPMPGARPDSMRNIGEINHVDPYSGQWTGYGTDPYPAGNRVWSSDDWKMYEWARTLPDNDPRKAQIFQHLGTTQ
jgi:hypothetical protein